MFENIYQKEESVNESLTTIKHGSVIVYDEML